MKRVRTLIWSAWLQSRTLTFADGRVDDLEDANGECSGFAGTGLCLGDGVATSADLDNGA